MTISRIALHLANDHDPDWLGWVQTWKQKPNPDSWVEYELIDNTLQCSWVEDGPPVAVTWTDRELLDAIKNKTDAVVAGPLLWRMARITSESGELDALMRHLVVKETGLTLEPTPFVRKGLEITSRMDAKVADGAKKSRLVSVTLDQHGTLIKLTLTDPQIRALLDRFLRRQLWTA